jgi:hypothetical protein
VSRCGGGGGDRENSTHEDRAVPTLLKQIQRKYFFDREIGFVSISRVKVFFPTCLILKKYSGDGHKFCITLMDKFVGKIGNLNSD